MSVIQFPGTKSRLPEKLLIDVVIEGTLAKMQKSVEPLDPDPFPKFILYAADQLSEMGADMYDEDRDALLYEYVNWLPIMVSYTLGAKTAEDFYRYLNDRFSDN